MVCSSISWSTSEDLSGLDGRDVVTGVVGQPPVGLEGVGSLLCGGEEGPSMRARLLRSW